MVNIMEGNFNFPMYSILIPQSIVNTTGKFELIGKLTLYVISQG